MNQKFIRKRVEEYIKAEGQYVSTQKLLDSGAVPRLQGYIVRPGKVSNSIFGGKGSYVDKASGESVEFENPPLLDKNGIPLRLMVRTDRISTHDINRGSIPFKDQILAENHYLMRKLLRSAVGTSQYDVGLSSNAVVIAAEDLKQISIEMVLRAYAAESTTSTSLYQAYFVRGERRFCGHPLPEGLIPNGRLPYVMDTPSTKSELHDESIAPAVLFERGICTPDNYQQIRNGALVAFGIASHFLLQKGILLIDTKTEHGVNTKGQIVSQDELYTFDSSRFWKWKEYKEQLGKLCEGRIEKLNPTSYSKEFARGFSIGEQGYSDEERIKIAIRYYQSIQLLNKNLCEFDMRPREQRVVSGLQTIVDQLVA